MLRSLDSRPDLSQLRYQCQSDSGGSLFPSALRHGLKGPAKSDKCWADSNAERKWNMSVHVKPLQKCYFHNINHSQVCGIGFPTLQSDRLRQLQNQNPRLLEKTIDRRLVKYWRGFLCTSNVWSDWSSHRVKLEVSHFNLFSKRIESRFSILQPLSTYVTIPSQALPTVLQHHFINHLGAASKRGRPKKKVGHR